MVNRINSKITREFDKLNERDSFAALDTAQHHTTPRSAHKKEFINDDPIGSLIDAYENKRARQVTEWERAQSRYVRAA